jgi:hypothetical protein|tara:strand:- start:217 stop:882 length:666 start_codon:yes stop_codon:yes gene_type:complete
VKISSETQAILKNFATINSGIKVGQGNQLKTISNMKNILAVANVPETFTQEFNIYNLVEFLGAISLTENPDFNFNESSLTIADADTSLTYFYASEGMVTTVDKMITMPDSEINIDLSSTLLTELQKAASILGVNDLIMTSDGTKINMQVTDKKNPTSNTFSRIVGEGNGSTFTMNFKIENLKVLDGNYSVAVSSKGISHFKNKDVDLEYFIALEPDSSYSA